GLELGAIDYLTKPFRKEEILLKVRNILEYQEQFRKHLTKESNDKSANENKNISIVKNLTRRELEIATLAASYYSSKEISIFTNIPKKIKPRHKTEPI
ncbi:MAG TPA: hypothetical protein PK771_12835, partial [Spirochaetota bacterium]|nr:hypothetical protein [Spirochaetota bacterium]